MMDGWMGREKNNEMRIEDAADNRYNKK